MVTHSSNEIPAKYAESPYKAFILKTLHLMSKSINECFRNPQEMENCMTSCKTAYILTTYKSY